MAIHDEGTYRPDQNTLALLKTSSLKDIATPPGNRFSPAKPWLDIVFGILAIVGGGAVVVIVLGTPDNLRLLAIVLGLLAMFATIARPERGLVALAFIVYTRFSDIATRYHNAPSIFLPFVLLLLSAIFVRWFFYKEKPIGWLRPTALLALYGLVGYLSLLYADNFDRAQRTLYFFFRDSLAAVIIVILLQQAATLRRVIWALLAAGIFMGTITVYQQLTGTFSNNYGGFAQAGINFIAGGANDYRIAGPFANPNAYAQILNVLIPLALDRLWNERTRPLRLFAAWALTVCVLSVFFTFSRGGFLTLVFVFALMLIRRPPRLSVLLVTVAIAIPLFQFLPANYTDRVMTLTDLLPGSENSLIEDGSFRGRTSENAVAWLMFMDQPILGVGLDNYPEKYLEYSSLLGIDPRREARAPSSLYLEILAEEGLLGLGVFLTILGVMLYGLQRAKENFTVAGMNDYASMAIAFTIAMLGYLFAALFKNSAYFNFFWMLTGIALAISRVADNEVQAYRDAQETRLSQTALP